MPAPRPANSRLDTSKVMSVFGLNLPSWRDEVAQVVETLIKAQ
jgi:dTDP-4-dehydrorhamnose reductase